MNKKEIIDYLIEYLKELKKKHEFDYDIEIKCEPQIEEILPPENLSPYKKIRNIGVKNTIIIKEKKYDYLRGEE